MQAQLIGDLAQHQRAHGQLAMGEEILLPLHNRAAHAQDGVKALLDVLDEPARFLQPLMQRLSVLALVLLERAGIQVMHAQAGHDLAVERHLETPARFHDDNVRHDKVALHTRKAAAGLGVQPCNHGDGALDHAFRKTAQERQALDIALGQQFHGLLAHGHGGAGFFAIRAIRQLQTQALGQIARANAGRLHVLQQLQGHGKVLFQLFGLLKVVTRKTGGQRSQAVFQVAVIVERLDQEMQRRAIDIGQAQAKRLPVQMVLQRLVVAHQVRRFGIAVVQVVFARRRIAAPLAVVGPGLNRAVAVPAFFELGLQARFCAGFRVIFACSPRSVCTISY